jgi:calcineurin-like phosphoesterase family protein
MRHESQNIFFISDLHLGHTNVLRYDNRPFANVDEMHSTLVERWNSVVGDDDIVYFLGDLFFSRIDTAVWFLNNVRGRISCVLGNHDREDQIRRLRRFENIYPYGVGIDIRDDNSPELRRNQGYRHVVLSHYPILSWNRAHHGSFHLHGHCHGNLLRTNPDYYRGRVMDVGCNLIDYTPISFNQVSEIMRERSSYHHH